MKLSENPFSSVAAGTKKVRISKLPEPVCEANRTAYPCYVDQLLLKAYSHNTIAVYTHEFAQLLGVLNDVYVSTLTAEKLKSYSCIASKR